jgi:hypothetical protein
MAVSLSNDSARYTLLKIMSLKVQCGFRYTFYPTSLLTKSKSADAR